jgi:hypothetical protein
MEPKIYDKHWQKENGLELKAKRNPIPDGGCQWFLFL